MSGGLCHRHFGSAGRDVMCDVCGGAVQQCVDDSMCTVCSRTVPRLWRTVLLRSMWRWVDDGHSGAGWGQELHGVCGGAVQQRIDGGVYGVSGGLCHRHFGSAGRDVMCDVCGGAVQQCVDDSMCAVRIWL